jgi:hypothetical protein
MRFCISTIDFWNSIGFNVSNWRKSSNGLKALCHDKFAEVLIENIEDNEDIEIYNIDDESFIQILDDEFTTEKPE